MNKGKEYFWLASKFLAVDVLLVNVMLKKKVTILRAIHLVNKHKNGKAE